MKSSKKIVFTSIILFCISFFLLLAACFGVKVEAKEVKPITITRQPYNQYTRHSGTVTFVLKAKGKGLTYQWYVKKSDQWKKIKKVKHSDESSFTLECTRKMNGWKFRCLVKDKYGNEKWSRSAKLTITDKGKKYIRNIPLDSARGMFLPKSADNYCYVYSYYSRFKSEIKKAIEIINQTIGMTFIYTDSPHIADIVITDYENNKLKDSIWLLSNEIALVEKYGDEWAGVAFSSPELEVHYLVLLNRTYLDCLKSRNIQAIVMHELGHCIGIPHSYFDPNDIMAPEGIGRPVMTKNDIQSFTRQRKALRNILNSKNRNYFIGNQFCKIRIMKR